jgi:hypothetical protein
MARVAPQIETLFDLDPTGGFVMPGADVMVHTAESVVEPAIDVRDPAVWQEGLDYPLSQGERAMIAVSPTGVNVAQRAGHLTLALTKLSAANRDRGFGKAAQTEAHRAEVVAWGGTGTDDVADELAYRALTGERSARYDFFAASGLGYLAVRPNARLSGTERLARNYVDGMWGGFQKQYGAAGPAARQERNRLKRQLAKYANPEDTEA